MTSSSPGTHRCRGRGRVRLVVAALIGFAVVAVFGLVVIQDRSPLDAFDRWGRQAEDWADNHAALVTVLRTIEVTFATVGMIVWTTLVAVAVLSRRRYRAAAFAIAVMIATSLTTTAIKLALGRGRPEWQDATDLLSSKSFPSGHASSSAALAGHPDLPGLELPAPAGGALGGHGGGRGGVARGVPRSRAARPSLPERRRGRLRARGVDGAARDRGVRPRPGPRAWAVS